MEARPHWRVRSTDHIALGLAVRELRERRGVQQTAVSVDAGMDYKYVSKVERGVQNASFGTLLRIVRTLGFTLSELAESYERHIAQIDPRAGHDVPLCPTPAALAVVRRIGDEHAAYYARKTRSTRGRMGPWT